MFTVKWIAGNGAHHLYSVAKEVSFTPRDSNRPKPMVSFYDGLDFVTLDCGEVYVMNENGRTVSNYVLSTEDFPAGIHPKAA